MVLPLIWTGILFQDLTMYELGGDGSGKLSVPAVRRVTIAEDELRTHLWSTLNNEGTLNLPVTTYVEQDFTTNGRMIGVQHLYTRGSTRLGSSASAECSTRAAIEGHFIFHTFTVLDGGDFSFVEESHYDVDDGMVVFADLFHMEGASVGEISRACYVMGRQSQIEKQAVISGSYLGYPANSGPGAGQSCTCGSGAGHGGAGGQCKYCDCSNCQDHYSHCNGGTTYDSRVTPSVAGSGGGAAGGSALRLVHQSTTVDGLIHMNGQTSSGGTGGGSGGAVWIDAEYVYGWGQLRANGGGGSNHVWNTKYCRYERYGGGGGGGRIRSFGSEETSKVLLHYRTVSGGSSSYSAGGTGSLHQSHSNTCSGHGQWDSSTSSCQCQSGYVGIDCQYLCHDAETCSGNGVCTNKGTCDCDDNYVGYHCENMCHRNTSCSGHGDCSTCGTCICDPCYHGLDCATECSDNGQCVADKCECDGCHLGRYCESECNSHGTCNAGNMTCTCEESWRGQKCTIPGCPGKDLDCSGHGVCNAAIGFCYCDPGYKGQL